MVVEEKRWRLEWSIPVEEMLLHRLCLPVLWRAIRLLFHFVNACIQGESDSGDEHLTLQYGPFTTIKHVLCSID